MRQELGGDIPLHQPSPAVYGIWESVLIKVGPPAGSGVEPQPQMISGACAILCDFTHLLVHLTAAWK